MQRRGYHFSYPASEQEIRIQIIPIGNGDRIFQIVMLISFNIWILIQEVPIE